LEKKRQKYDFLTSLSFYKIFYHQTLVNYIYRRVENERRDIILRRTSVAYKIQVEKRNEMMVDEMIVDGYW